MLQEKRIISHLDQLEVQFLEHLIWICPWDLSWLHSFIEVRSSSTNFSSVSNHINVSPSPEDRRETEDFVQQSSEVEETSRLDSELINLTDENDDESCFSSPENDEVQAALSDGDSELLRKA